MWLTVPEVNSAVYVYFGRYQLNYCYVQKKNLRDTDSLITVHEYNCMQCLLKGGVCFILLLICGRRLLERVMFIGGKCLLEGGVYWRTVIIGGWCLLEGAVHWTKYGMLGRGYHSVLGRYLAVSSSHNYY